MMARIEVGEIRCVIDTWIDRLHDLERDGNVRYVQNFENRGAVMGASNSHPHSQICATSEMPTEITKEHGSLTVHLTKNGVNLLDDSAALERENGNRVVYENDDFLVTIPFWAVWPFETLVIATKPAASLTDLDDGARNGLAEALRVLTRGYDALFQPRPVLDGFSRSADGAESPAWRLRAPFIHRSCARPNVHGRLRAHGHAAARYHARVGTIVAARGETGE